VVSPATSIVLTVISVSLIGLAAVADHHNQTRRAAALLTVGASTFLIMMATLGKVDWGMAPEPPRYDRDTCRMLLWNGERWSCSPFDWKIAPDTPHYDPHACPDVAWLDERWTCIPFEEQG
jgi:hypothetical protein